MVKSLCKNGARPAFYNPKFHFGVIKLNCYGSFGGVQEWLPGFLLIFFLFPFVN